MKKISIVSPTYNEEGNVSLLYDRVCQAMSNEPEEFEIIFIDNASTDNTVSILRSLASKDKRVKVILNETNFGHIRSPYHALLQAEGDAAVLIASDLQDPPEIIPLLLSEWRKGSKVVLASKSTSDERFPLRQIRKGYYRLLSRLSNASLVQNATGTGIFDNEVLGQLRRLGDPYPYFRGLVTELGFKVEVVEFHQPPRYSGDTKNNWLTLYDIAMLGMTTHGGSAIRLISIFGFGLATLSFLVGIAYLIAKLVAWDSFDLGLAPLIIGVFFFSSIQIAILGFLGEYLLGIQRRQRNLPLVIEAERINF